MIILLLLLCTVCWFSLASLLVKLGFSLSGTVTANRPGIAEIVGSSQDLKTSQHITYKPNISLDSDSCRKCGKITNATSIKKATVSYVLNRTSYLRCYMCTN